ncbi:MAG: glycosyl hydrolase family 8 [Elainellaceae cyanobacterium]
MAIARRLLLGFAVALVSCSGPEPPEPPEPAPVPSVNPAPAAVDPAAGDPSQQQLDESWRAYKRRFIQADGRVIDREASDRTVSEGQAYALLRAVMADDPVTFSMVLTWAENNLAVQTESGQAHQLWAWQWGVDEADQWGILDANFASDADLDAATALILAARQWDQPQYLDLAKAKLADLWSLSTIAVPIYAADEESGEGRRDAAGATVSDVGDRYFLPGPKEAFQPAPNQVYLNPSYLAPYAFRLFAQVDPAHDWLTLVDSSYSILTQSAEVSAVRLPSDWVALNLATGRYTPIDPDTGLSSRYGFDAYRVWWRVALDAALTEEPRALAYLNQHLTPLVEFWQTTGQIPAEIGLQGEPLVDYDSPAQYGMVYPALQQTSPEVAAQILNQELSSIYSSGIWGSDTAYYTQNLIWLGLYPVPQLNTLDWQMAPDRQSSAQS